MSKKLDFNAIDKAALPFLPELLKRWLPDGRLSGKEWEAKNPRRNDNNIGSFKINIWTGGWSDFADGTKGVGAISFATYIFDTPAKQVAKCLAAMLQGKDCGNAMFAPMPATVAVKATAENEGKEWQPIVPVPKNAPSPKTHHKRRQAVHSWEYRDAQDRLIFIVSRFDKSDGGKDIIPQTFCEHADGRREWQWQSLPAPRPLYGLSALASRPEADIIVVEGEKTADAATSLFPDYVAITSPGGAGSASKADWSVLSGRTVKIWPDNDETGKAYAADAAKLALAAGALSVAIVEIPTDFPEKWDLADAPPDGWDDTMLRELLKTQTIDFTAPALSASTPNGALKFEEETQAETLINLANTGEYFHTPDGVPCVDARIENGQRRTYLVESRDTKSWLTHLYYKRTGDAPSPEAMKKAIATLAARARYDGEEHRVFIRVGGHEGKTYIDLCDDTGCAIEVDESGWRIIIESPIRFLRKKGMLALPAPVVGGSIKQLRGHINTRDDDGFVLIVAWLLMALCPHGTVPYSRLNRRTWHLEKYLVENIAQVG